MPPEWSAHVATWLSFPHHRTDFPGKLSAVVHVFAEMARVISQGERVRLIVRDTTERKRAQQIFSDDGVNLERVDFVQLATNRSWVRDSLPLWVTKGGSQPIAVKFRFDGWSRYRDHKQDDAAGRAVAKKFGSSFVFPRAYGRHLVLEGGSIDISEDQTVLTTRECLVTSERARFPEGLEAAEQALCQYLGAKKVLWLPTGIAGDDTSGHVDDFARFAPGGRVLLCQERDRSDVNYTALRKARAALQGATTASGRPLEIVSLPMPRPVYYRGERLPASYANFYVANSAVLVPVFNDAADREALSIIAECFPDRPAVGIYARDLVVGLGTLHCSSMQQPNP
jgi:agmatine deiminase